jgi:hypothetical protein
MVDHADHHRDADQHHADGHNHPHRAGHNHPHGSGHDHDPLGHYAHVQGGPPLLDIGGDIGALVATMDHGTAGAELHLRPAHDPSSTVHTGVWERHHDGSTVTAAVFSELLAGTYHVLDDDDGAPTFTVEIHGGIVSTADLRGRHTR